MTVHTRARAAARGTDPSRGGRSARAALAVVLLLFVAVTVAAAAGPDPTAAAGARFDAAYAAFRGWFTGEQDETGTRYEHWRFHSAADPRERRIDTEIDYARMGRGADIAVLRRDRNAQPGYSLDYLHPAGSDFDFVLLGDRFVHPIDPAETAEPTPWIARPTTLAATPGGATSWSPCATAGTSLFCSLDAAVADSRAALPAVPRTTSQSPDGAVSARTGVRLIDLIARDLTPLNAHQLVALEPALDALIPLTITLEPDGTFRRAELDGQLTTASAQLQVQLGIEHRGTATPADFPQPPPLRSPQVRRVDRLEYVFLLQAIDDERERAGYAEAPPP